MNFSIVIFEIVSDPFFPGFKLSDSVLIFSQMICC